MPTVEELKDGRVPWSRDGIYLRHRPAFTFDPLLHAGAYYVQEASSMFIQQVLKGREERKEKSPLLVLDLCSAPGGKSTAVRAMLPEGSLLICNEPVRQRAQILAENISKEMPTITARDCQRHLAMPTPRRPAHLLYLHFQRS